MLTLCLVKETNLGYRRQNKTFDFHKQVPHVLEASSRHFLNLNLFPMCFQLCLSRWIRRRRSLVFSQQPLPEEPQRRLRHQREEIQKFTFPAPVPLSRTQAAVAPHRTENRESYYCHSSQTHLSSGSFRLMSRLFIILILDESLYGSRLYLHRYR